MLHSWADSKKKSNLMLVTFTPCVHLSWLGNIKKLGPATELSTNPYGLTQDDEAETTPFPVTPARRKSYISQASVVWVKPSGLQVTRFFYKNQ